MGNYSREGEDACLRCRVDLTDNNKDAAKIFLITRSQVIMSHNGPVDINQLAVHAAMILYGVEDQRRCFEKVLLVFDHWLNLKKETGNAGL
jgi:hypothetical protein